MNHTPNAGPEDFDPFAAGAIERVIGSTEAQREIWLADRLAPEASLAYNESVSLLLRGPLSTEALRGALDQTVARHESLRATLSGDGMQLLIDEAAPLEMPMRDLCELDAPAREAALAKARADAVETQFDLERGPLIRAELLRREPELHELLLSAHHIVCDGWSWGRIVEDLGLLYAQAVGIGIAPLPAPASYEDYVQWEHDEAAGPQMHEHTRFWVERFAGGSAPVLDLPADRSRPPVRTFGSRRTDVLIEADLIQKVRNLGAASGASLFATLFSAFAGTMHRLAQQADLVIGVAAAGQSASDMPNLVGHCVNVLPIRIGVDDTLDMKALVQQSSTTLLDAFEHQTMTYGSLLKKLQLPRDPSRPTLVSVVFNLDQEAVLPKDAFPGLAVDVVANPRHFENFELFLNCTPTARGLQLECQYNTGLFDEASVRRWLAMLHTALQRFAADPAVTVAQAFALDDADRALLASFNRDTASAAPEELLHVRFERMAAAQPEAPALRFEQRTVSYGELNAQANRIAHRLLALGVRPDSLVGLCTERSVNMLAGVLGILKAGGAYVPLDPSYPADRLAHILRDSAPKVLLTQSHLAARVPPGDATVVTLDNDALLPSQPAHDPDPAVLGLVPSNLAYVIYTSGSTGLPKGVLVEHRQVNRLFNATDPWYSFGKQDVWTLFHSFAFDFSVWELWGALLYGGQLVVVPQLTSRDPQAFYQLLCDEGVTVLNQTPSAFRQLMSAQAQASGAAHRLRTVIFGGEKLEPTMLKPWYMREVNRGTQLVNMYGITETTVHVTYRPLSAQDADKIGTSPIGQRIPDLTIHVLDAHRQPVPVGVVGELFVGGAGVARGYLNRPELNAERFIPDPFAGETGARLYKTGDLGRYLGDGSLEYLGRNDFQVKVRGFRIELGEIEARLAACDGVREATVIAREDVPGDVRLVGYVSAQGGGALEPAALRKALATSLPDYMVPAAVIVMPGLPLNSSGKLDRKALPAPELQHILGGAASRVRVEPGSDLEREVLGHMEQVLSLPGLSMEDDFFALGGHSLLAARLVAALGRALDMKLPLGMLFQAPTPARLSRAIEDARAQGQVRARAIIAHRADQHGAPLTPMQERIRFIEELHPDRAIYNAPSGHRLFGSLDLKAFEAAFREIIRRQPSLRTVMGADAATGMPAAIVRDTLDFTLAVEDLRGLPEAEREPALRTRLDALAGPGIDIHRGPLWRAALYRMAEQEWALGFVPHHLIWDGWSFDIFQSDLSAIYGAFSQGQPSPLPELALTHGDYASWYVHWLTQPEAQAQRTYWKERFARVPPSLAASTDVPRGVGQTGRGRSCFLHIDQATTDRLHQVARRHDVTLNMLTLGVLALLMGSVIGTRSVVVATPVRGRDLPELEPIMGFFNNLVPIPLEVGNAQTLRAYLQDVKRELIASMDHQQIPFEELATEPEFTRRTQGSTLYQVLFSFQDARERPLSIGTLRHEQLHIPQRGATDDLGLWLMEKGHGLTGAITYNADIYREETGETFRERYIELLQRVIDMPEATLDALSEPGDSSAAKSLARLAANPDATPRAEPREVPTTLLMPEQAELAQVWASVLGLDVNDIHPTDTFFDLGGDSLLAMRAVRQAEQALGYRIEARRYLFESLAQLSASGPADAMHAGEPDLVLNAAKEDAPRGLLGRMKAALGRH